MFKLVIIPLLAGIVSVQCGTILTPIVGKLVSEKIVESHGNDVVHASAPLLAAAAPVLRYTNVAQIQPQPFVQILHPVAKTSLIAEKTVEAHGHQVVHNAHPLNIVESRVIVPAIATRELPHVAPIYYPAYPHLVAEKTVSSYGHSIRHVA